MDRSLVQRDDYDKVRREWVQTHDNHLPKELIFRYVFSDVTDYILFKS